MLCGKVSVIGWTADTRHVERVTHAESMPGPRHRLGSSLFSLCPPGLPAVPPNLCHAAIRSRLLAEPDLEFRAQHPSRFGGARPINPRPAPPI
jgi:hypothetical protein